MNDTHARIYRVKLLDPSQKQWWNQTAEAELDCFPWASTIDYRPKTVARLGTGGASLSVYMESDETDLRTETKGFGPVHTDSCMEFFLSPDPGAFPKYLNFEYNPLGAMHLAVGTCRHDRSVLPINDYRELFKVKTAVSGKGWALEFHIPLPFLREFFPALELKPGLAMRGNFYKCGDLCARPHYGCWSPIALPKPDFHCPDYFGTLIIGGE
jgi:hypothetical protein